MKAITFHSLLDVETFALVIASPQPSILVLLNEWSGKTFFFPNAHYPNYDTGRFYSKLKQGEYVKWTWDFRQRYFVKTRKELLTDELRARSNLMSAKHDLIAKILFNLNSARYPVRSGLDFQETVYMTKKIEAQRFKDNGYDEGTVIEYPYVLQYAEFAGISPREAADAILLKASFDDQSLARTELLRLKFLNKIKNAHEEAGLRGILEEFYRECYTNAHV